MILGITGTDGSGKGAVVEYLVNAKGFVHYSARALWEEEIQRRGLQSSRANMRLVANELRAKHGDDFLIQHYLKRYEEEKPEHVIIESIRAVAEAKTLAENGGILIAVDADQKLRYERIVQRKSSSDQISFEDFCAHEQLEMNDPDPHGMQKKKVMEMADYTIVNNGALEELHAHIEEVLKKIG